MRLTFCAACGAQDPGSLEHHHLLPRVEGGLDVEENLITLCCGCHGIVHGTIRRPIVELTRIGREIHKQNAALHFGKTKLKKVPRRPRIRSTKCKDQMVERAKILGAMFDDIRAGGATSLRQIAKEMNERGLRNRKGGEWRHDSVRALLVRLAKHDPNHPYEPVKQGGPKKLSSPLARARAPDPLPILLPAAP